MVGEGGFIGEASLAEISEEDYRRVARRGRYVCELTDVYVHPLRRRLGWAREVVRVALDYADEEEWDVFLRVVEYGTTGKWGRASTEQLIKFYASMGFTQLKADPREMIRRYRAH